MRLSTLSFVTLCALALALISVPLRAAASTQEAGFDAPLAKASLFEAEQSWALAKAAYAEALAKAETPVQRRDTALLLENATWRSDEQPDWNERAAWIRRHSAVYERLLEAYAKGDRARDAFWLAVQKSYAEFEDAFNVSGHWARRGEIADYLGSQPPSDAAAAAYVAFLQASISHRPGLEFSPLMLPHLRNGMRVGATADDRAWCAWQIAHQYQSPTQSTPAQMKLLRQERAKHWEEAQSLAKGTRWEILVNAEALIWRSETGWSPSEPVNTPADLPSIITELDRQRALLRTQDDNRECNALRDQMVALANQYSEPQLNTKMADILPPGQDVQLSYGACGVGRLDFALHQLSAEEYLKNDDTVVRVANINDNAGKLLREWSITLPEPRRHLWHSDLVNLGNKLSPGFYVLTVTSADIAEGNPTMDRHPFLITSIRGIAYSQSGSDRAEMTVLSLIDGKPIIAATNFWIRAFQEDAIKEWSGITNTEGKVKFPIEVAKSQRCVGVVGEQPFAFTLNSRGPEQTLMIADLFVDRPLFRPGETVHWKLILRERHDGHFVLPDKNTKLRYGVTLGNESLVDARSLILDSHGTTQGEITIPTDAHPGEASLQLGTEIATGRRDGSSLWLPFFRVDNFVPPAVTASVELASSPASLRAGGELVFKVKSSYFSGGAVVGAPVTCQLRAIFPAEKSESTLRAWRDNLFHDPRKGTTDALGNAEFRLQLPPDIPDGSRISCYASVLTEGAQEVRADASFSLSASGYAIDVMTWAKPRLVKPGEPLTLRARIVDTQNKPVATEVVARVVELRWNEVLRGPKGELLTGSAAAEFRRNWLRRQVKAHGNRFEQLPPGWALIDGNYSETPVVVQVVRSSAEGSVEVPFTAPASGIYQLRFVANSFELRDAKPRRGWDNLFSSTLNRDKPHPEEALTLVAADASTSSIALAPDKVAVIAPESYSAGEELCVLAIVPIAADEAWLSVEGENESVVSRLVMSDRVAFRSISSSPGFLGLGRLLLSSASLGSTFCTFKASSSANRIDLRLIPAARENKPGTQQSFTLEARDARGRPARGELAFAVSDEAIERLLPDRNETSAFLEAHHICSSSLANFGLSWSLPSKIVDPRPGVTLNPSEPSDEETIILTPFEVRSAEEHSYMASSTLAGTRIQTDLSDIGSAIAVVTPEFLKDVGATSRQGNQLSDDSLPDIEVRRHFSSTAFWAPEIVTDKDGRAQVSFKQPDNLTEWRAKAYFVGEDGESFGSAHVLTKTSLPLQARLQAPRFLVAGDRAELQAVLVNRSEAEFKADAELKVGGATALLNPAQVRQTALRVPAQAEAHASWSVTAREPGKAMLDLSAHSGKETDAMSISLPVIEDGLQQETASTGGLAPTEKDSRFSLALPASLDPKRSEVSVELTSGCAAAILDSLPYLVDYPYGCVEQTMSRFLPAIVVRKTLVDQKLDAAAVERRILSRESTADAKRRGETAGLGKLDEVVERSLARLAEANNYGSFDWWPGSQRTNLWMTAYVNWGLNLAKATGVEVDSALIDRSREILAREVVAKRGDADEKAFALMTLSTQLNKVQGLQIKSLFESFNALLADREKLTASGRACLALASATLGTQAQRELLLRNLENGGERVEADGAVSFIHWGKSRGYWRAMDSSVEATSLTLLAFLQLNPNHPLIEPAAKWLLLNRRSSHWASTRDTAFAVLALTRYMEERGDFETSGEVELRINGASLGRVTFSRESLLEGPRRLAVPVDRLRGGENVIELHRISGSGPVHAMALASAWAPSAIIKPAANLIATSREFERRAASPTLMGTLRIEPSLLADGGSAQVGEEVRARVRIEAPAELEYLMIEVPKPAGCEPLNPLSGWDARLHRVTSSGEPESEEADDSSGARLYREERDDRSVFFLSRLSAGTWEIRFGLRAVTPGDFRALPVKVSAMYVPELRANSDARRLRLESSSEK